MEQRAAEWSKADTDMVEAMLEGLKDCLSATKKSQAKLQATVNMLKETTNTMEFIVLMLRFIEHLSAEDKKKTDVGAIKTLVISLIDLEGEVEGDYGFISLVKDAISALIPDHLLLQLTEADLKNDSIDSALLKIMQRHAQVHTEELSSDPVLSQWVQQYVRIYPNKDYGSILEKVMGGHT